MFTPVCFKESVPLKLGVLNIGCCIPQIDFQNFFSIKKF